MFSVQKIWAKNAVPTKKHRIALVEYDHSFLGKKRAYALQRRVGIFFWHTVTYCDSVSQCLTYYKNTKDKKEKLINVLRSL